ncbi:hypothetical protein Hanom_Chr01g00025651 [Helianthus anomalus]
MYYFFMMKMMMCWSGRRRHRRSHNSGGGSEQVLLDLVPVQVVDSVQVVLIGSSFVSEFGSNLVRVHVICGSGSRNGSTPCNPA